MFDKDAVKAAYEDFASDFDAGWPLHIRSHQEWIAAHWPAACPENGTALDLGCGTGWMLKHLSAAHPAMSLYGSDFSPAMLEIARKAAPDAEIISGDIEDDAFTATLPQADIVLSLGILHHMADIDAHLRLLRQLGKAGGTAFLSCFACDGDMMQAYDAYLQEHYDFYNQSLPHDVLTARLEAFYPAAITAKEVFTGDADTLWQIFRLDFPKS
ncbi:MAG: methyltransferase domain-containing protein [Pseudomonadota bacterium]|nr:class I SAM-dependent methyltransferase [Pseudomonadota bacterium]QKK04825.1 MAG: methyltransferase domain-containing protein [Pseudomonadota bacterium]